VWNPETGDVVTLRGHRRSTWMVDFRQTDGAGSEDALVSASSDSTRVWRMQAALQAMPLSQDDADRVQGSVEVAAEPLSVYNKVHRQHIAFPVPPESLAAVSPDGAHVLVARQDADQLGSRLMLYDSTSSSEPVAVFRAPLVDWKSVGFLSDPDRVVAITATGVAHSWRYFRTPAQLTAFALKHLPLQDGRTVELPAADLCRFGIRPVSACQEVFAQQGSNRRGSF
jgi:hypothetical protein